MLRLQLACEGEKVWISCAATEKVQHVLDAASRRWERVVGRRPGDAMWVKFDGARLHAEDVLGDFVGDKDVVEVGFGVAVATGESVAHDMDQLEKALQELFEGGPMKTVSELEEFRGLEQAAAAGGGSVSEGEEEDELADDEHPLSLAVAMYNFVPEEEDEVGFQTGDELVVFRKREDGWWRGRQMRPADSPVGYFPGNRVKEVEMDEAAIKKASLRPAATPPQQPQQKQEARPTSSTATMEREEVVVKVESAPGHGSPEMLRQCMLESVETRVEVWRATMDTEAVQVVLSEPVSLAAPAAAQPELPRRSVSMDSRAAAEATRLAEAGDWEGADRLLSEAIEASSRGGGGGGAALYCARAEAREHLKRMREALLDYSSCLQLQPRHVAALLGRARLAAVASKHAVARHDYLSVLKLQPKNTVALLGAAAAEEALSNPAAAAAQLECVLANEPLHGETLRRLARLRAASKDHAAARDLLVRATGAGGGNAATWLQLGAACAELQLHGEAAAAYGHTVALNPSDWAAWRAKAMAHASMSQWREACENLSTALHCAGNNAPFSLHAELAVALTRLTRHAEAQLQWQAAVDKRAKDPWLLASLASCLRQNGKLEEAHRQASLALELDPKRVKVLLLRAQLTVALGKPRAEAVADLTRALQLEPNLVAAKEELKRLSA